MATTIGKFWLAGAPLPAVNQPEQTGEQRYWLGGLPLPVLNSFGAPPLPPAGSGALPRGIRRALAAGEAPAWRAPATRRFAPIYAVATATDDGVISILW